jgi:hypothetical protein
MDGLMVCVEPAAVVVGDGRGMDKLERMGSGETLRGTAMKCPANEKRHLYGRTTQKVNKRYVTPQARHCNCALDELGIIVTRAAGNIKHKT